MKIDLLSIELKNLRKVAQIPNVIVVCLNYTGHNKISYKF